MQDLTKINVPFGLLDKETQERLKAHGGPYEFYTKGDNWESFNNLEPSWHECYVYRVKSQPEPKAPEKPEVLAGSWWIDGKGDCIEILYVHGNTVFYRDHGYKINHLRDSYDMFTVSEVLKYCTPYTPPRKCEGWVNVYEVDGELKLGVKTYQSEKEAEDGTLHYTKRIATVKVQYTEGQDND